MSDTPDQPDYAAIRARIKAAQDTPKAKPVTPAQLRYQVMTTMFLANRDADNS